MRELERLLRGRRFPPPADAETASAPLARLGPGVVVYPEVVVIDGARFPRRQYRREPPLDPLPARRPLDPTWESQLDHLSPPAALEAAIPDEGEIFTYISPTMARILRRIATVDSAHGFVLLVGPTGCGKTTLAKTYCWLTRQPLTELTFSGDTTLTDFYRSVEVVRDAQGRQSTVTVPGPAVEAMLRGKKLLINEINMLPPDILTVFTQAMDTGRLILSGTQRGNIEINVHRDFGIIGTANPHYIGTLDIGRAMERRFGRGLGYIEMTFLPPEEEAAAVANEFSRLALFARHNLTAPQDLCLRLATLAARLRSDPQIGPVIQSRLSTRSLVHWLGLAQITGLPLREIAAQALLTTVPRDAREKALALIQEALGGPPQHTGPPQNDGPQPPAPNPAPHSDPTPRRLDAAGLVQGGGGPPPPRPGPGADRRRSPPGDARRAPPGPDDAAPAVAGTPTGPRRRGGRPPGTLPETSSRRHARPHRRAVLSGRRSPRRSGAEDPRLRPPRPADHRPAPAGDHRRHLAR
jgi:MoxR-like ATPase